MSFNPNIGDPITIGNQTLFFEPNPAADTFVYKQTGKKGTVFQISNEDKTAKYALKMFHPAYRSQEVVRSAESIQPFEALAGLRVCQRQVLRKETYGDLVKQYPDLEYAVLMPWIEGDTWEDLIYGQRSLTADQSFEYAMCMATILAGLELNGLAHCDIAGANIILCDGRIELVDVEDMFGPGFVQPSAPPSGQDGYAFRNPSPVTGLWCSEGDRFSGAVILIELLLWHNKIFRDKRDGVAFFSRTETLTQDQGDRYRLAQSLLRNRYGVEIAGIFEAAWHATSLAECPRLTDWHQSINPGIIAQPPPTLPESVSGAALSVNLPGGAFGDWGKPEGMSGKGRAPVLPAPTAGPRLKLTAIELSLLVAGLPVIGALLVLVLTPILTQSSLVVDYLWGDLPLIAFVPSILYSAYRKLWATVLGYLATAIAGGLLVQLLVGTFEQGNVIDLLVGVFISSASLSFIVWVAGRLIHAPSSSTIEILVMAGATTLAVIVLYLIAFLYVPNMFWVAPFFSVVGWFLGERVRQGIIRLRDPKS